MEELSVIVPIYNVGLYLKECIDSIISNSEPSIDIILVDDGSKDDSGIICDEYANKYHNIRAIHQTNKGLVEARKVGALVAKGKYLTFCDGDDCIIEKQYEKACKYLEKYPDIDMLIGGMKVNGSNVTGELADGIYIGDEVQNIVFAGLLCNEKFERKTIPGIVLKYVRKDIFIETMHLVESSIRDGEDTLFTAACLLRCKKVAVKNNLCGYEYRLINESMSHERNSSYYDNANKMLSCLNIIIEANNDRRHLEEKMQWMSGYMIYRYMSREYQYCFGKKISKNESKVRCRNYAECVKKGLLGEHLRHANYLRSNLPLSIKIEMELLKRGWIKMSLCLAHIGEVVYSLREQRRQNGKRKY